MTAVRTSIVMAALAGAGAACGYSAPYRTSGPTLSDAGVQVAITGQRCIVNPSTDPLIPTPDDDLLWLDVRAQVSNQSSRTATLDPGRVVLVATKGSAPELARAQPAASIVLPAGSTRQVTLRFRHRGDMGCDQPLELVLARAIVASGKAVALTPIHFVATR